MHKLAGAAGGAPGEIALFHQQGLDPAADRFPQDTGAGNAAANNDQVPGVGLDLLENGVSVQWHGRVFRNKGEGVIFPGSCSR